MQTEIKRPSRIWWLYFAYLAIMWVLGVAMLLQHGSPFPRLAVATSLVDTVALVGLFLFIRSIPALAAGFWRFIFLLLIIKAALSAATVLRGLFSYPWQNLPEQRVALVILLTIVLGLPLIYAVGRYAFGSPHVWSKAQSISA